MVISVSLGAQSYPIILDSGVLAHAGEHLALARRVLVVTDSGVPEEYAETVAGACRQARICTVPAGESSKNMGSYQQLLGEMLALGMDRGDCVAAVGGGMVGDLAGFAAATYMRGCKFVQIPTSLLAMVDSSVGGKTAIDLAAGKNLAGAFWQPSVVIADVGCLATLTPEQFADGCGEVVKHAVIADPELFAELEKTPLTLELLNRDVARVALIIARNIDIKRAVVVADERETNQRKLLNFGHSAGHAVEACEHFELGHGNCVSIGMGIITRAAALHGVCDAALPGRIEELCARHGLKTHCDLDADAVFAEALHDKKRAGDTIDLVIPHDIGRCSIDRTPLSTFHDLIAEGLGQKGDASAC